MQCSALRIRTKRLLASASPAAKVFAVLARFRWTAGLPARRHAGQSQRRSPACSLLPSATSAFTRPSASYNQSWPLSSLVQLGTSPVTIGRTLLCGFCTLSVESSRSQASCHGFGWCKGRSECMSPNYSLKRTAAYRRLCYHAVTRQRPLSSSVRWHDLSASLSSHAL